MTLASTFPNTTVDQLLNTQTARIVSGVFGAHIVTGMCAARIASVGGLLGSMHITDCKCQESSEVVLLNTQTVCIVNGTCTALVWRLVVSWLHVLKMPDVGRQSLAHASQQIYVCCMVPYVT